MTPADIHQHVTHCRNLRDYAMRRARVHRAEGRADSVARCVRMARGWTRQIIDRRPQAA